jgi:DNA gyrase subunit A
VDLREGDRLIGVTWTTGRDHLLLGTRSGMSIRFQEGEARAMGRSAAGVKGIELKGGDEVVGLVKIAMDEGDDPNAAVQPEMDLLTVTERGYGKRTSLTEYLVASEQPDGSVSYRTQGRGGKGRIDIRTTSRNGEVVSVQAVTPDQDVVFITQGGLLVRSPAGQISRVGRATQGVRVVNLRDGDRLIAAAPTPAEEAEDEVEAGDAAGPVDGPVGGPGDAGVDGG